MSSRYSPPASPEIQAASIPPASKRRPVFLALLLAGLIAFLVWLPDATRESLWAALRAQQGMLMLLTAFALLTLSLIWTAGGRLDAWVFTFLNTRGYPVWLDRCMLVVTQVGNALVAVAAAFVFYALNYRRLAAEILIGTLTLWLLVELIKALSERDRPFLTLEKIRVIGWRERGDSFPSGHTTQTFFMMTLLIYTFQLGIGASIALYLLAGLVGVTRVYVGAHYPRDVIAGMVLGSIWGILATLVDQRWMAPRL